MNTRGRRLSVMAVIVVLIYVGWCGWTGRLSAGPRGLLHPVGAYWVTQDLRLTCVEPGTSGRSGKIRASFASDDEHEQVSVVAFDGKRVTLRGTLRHNVVRSDQPTNAITGDVVVTWPVGYSGQPVFDGDRQLNECSSPLAPSTHWSKG